MLRIYSPKVAHLVLLISFLLSANAGLAEPRPISEHTTKKVQAIVSELQARLQIAQRIEASIVPSEKRMVSVQRVHDAVSGTDSFEIHLDQTFFESLNREELRAALAHELGHVWISSHHPYLQTEALANEIAMRAVTRDSMKKIYIKLWLHLGTSGNLDELLGHDKTPSTQAAIGTA